MRLFCCGCQEHVGVRLTDGREVYPHLPGLFEIPFWKCDDCGNHVGCHHKTKNRTAPLGCIPTPEIKKARQDLHRLIDPLWRSGKISRRRLYAQIVEGFGRDNYHTADPRNLDEVAAVRGIVEQIAEAPDA